MSDYGGDDDMGYDGGEGDTYIEEIPDELEEDVQAPGDYTETVDQNQDDNVVVSGDPSAAAAAKNEEKNTVKSLKEKKVPNDKRTTTPYMTKYEKARVLGTRALQIRYVGRLSRNHLQFGQSKLTSM
ncbi:hypothetical protein K491DRAFT_689352 [Lophiostoma macrostomum CBS 122681]|uniref:RNA polymerase Rpb6 n=1 Tax=Lophiostoma macrostomum CBS 122681 TaxID=1314788 RepID=A0A6A6TIG9_9PLEO|nr:hypothetical protein K491DRAFT_689352 [Lophiostoma macrostomum CBS 122681]